MFNPFKYRPVSQQDDEDEDVLYQGKSIPLSNLGKAANSDDEVELELPNLRNPPTGTRRRNLFALCFIVAICIIFISLLFTLIFYVVSPLSPNGNSTTVANAQSGKGHNIVSSSATVISSSNAAVEHKANSEISTSPAPTSAAISTTNTKTELQSTTILKQGLSLIPVIITSTAILPVSTHDKPLSSPSTLQPVALTSTPTENLSPNYKNNITEMLDSTISTLIDPSVTTDSVAMVSSSQTLHPPVVSSYNEPFESTVLVPTATNFPTAQNNTIHWHTMNLDVSSETTPFVIDVNNDGIDDIIYAYSHFTKDLSMYYCTSNAYYEKACLEDTGYPVCGATLVAVNGLNGELIWLRNFTRPVFGIRCVMDVDEDGETDCFVIGRYHQWDTVNKATGETIWEADTTIGYAGYNFYYPLPLEDIDGDGVVDILNIHGGDQSYGPDETNRSPALIVILSGKTGKKLIDPIVVPDGRESYMSPVNYTFADKDVILFGTGGETINGSLWAITVDSIKEFVKSKRVTFNHIIEYDGCRSEFMDHRDRFRPKYDRTIYQLDKQGRRPSADCPSLGQHHLPIINKYKLCLYELYNSGSKGMIIPPVIIDMNNDNVQDLIIQSFSGHVLCLNGVDGEVLWHRYIPNSESYNIPAPLFYNDDDTPDIFLRVNIGEWDDYEYSYVVIIDGTDGKALWAMNSSYATMQSAVTLMSVNHSQDAVVFFAYNAIDTNDINSAMTKKRQADSDQQGTPLNDGEVPPSSMPFQTDSNQQGTPSYDGEVPPSSMPFQIDSDQQGEEPPSNMGIPPDIQNLNFKHLDEQFWNLSHASFPDPLVDPKGFMESCKYQSTMEQQCYLYLITRNLTTDNDNVDPVAATFPAILIPGYGMISGHDTEKRHEAFQPSLEMLDSMRNDAWRCSYIQSPSRYSPITPVLADLNHDGKFELIYGFQFASEDIYFSLSVGHSIFDLHIQTIDNMLQTDAIDFSKFLHMEGQSWTTYMGSKGDGMYYYNHV